MDIDLALDWNGVSMDADHPVTMGLPIARAQLADVRQCRLSVDGQAVALQTQALATWPDGSVKWLLLDFIAPVGSRRATLQYGPDAQPMAPALGIKATQVDNSVWLDAGQLALEVKGGGNGLLDRLIWQGRDVLAVAGKRLSFMDALHAESRAAYRPMDRNVAGEPDPSAVVVDKVTLETPGPVRATVLIEGRYTFKLMGSTIEGASVKGDCPFRVRLTAWADQPMLKVEHFFIYEGDGDHDFVRRLGLSLPLEGAIRSARFVGEGFERAVDAQHAGLYQQSADAWSIWQAPDDGGPATLATGGRFKGVLDVRSDGMGVAVGIRDFWQTPAKALHVNRRDNCVDVLFWPSEAPPLDFRVHSRQWSVGETGTPPDPEGDKPLPNEQVNHRLASKGVGKTHYALLCLHDGQADAQQLLGLYQLFCHRPMAWAAPEHYADTQALGRYHAPRAGMFDDLEEAIESPLEYWRHSQDHFRWYGFWLYGNVCQTLNEYIQNGRWNQEFGRWGWANGDSVGRLSQALALSAVRHTSRQHLEFAEKYLYNVHDCCCTHSESYASHNGTRWIWVKGAAHRHGAWPWACPYVGIRGAYPVGAKIYYYLTGEGHVRDIIDEVAELSVVNPHGGAGDGPLGINAQVALMLWERTGLDRWRSKLRVEIETSELLKKAEGGWLVMMSSAFGIFNALEEYMELTGDMSQAHLVASFADRAMPDLMRDHWSWAGYFRVYGLALRMTGQQKYRQALDEVFARYVRQMQASASQAVDRDDWPGPAGGPRSFTDGNIIRDIPYAMYAMANTAREGDK